MNANYKNYLSVTVWIMAFVMLGAIIGSLTKTEVSIWYGTLHRSPLTPPNYMFSVVWTLLYSMIAICGWSIWRTASFEQLTYIKSLYIMQLILNWSWTPLFFHYHLTGYALVSLLVMDMLVAMIIYWGYSKIRRVSLLMIPYLLWLLFATYLSFYIWHYN